LEEKEALYGKIEVTAKANGEVETQFHRRKYAAEHELEQKINQYDDDMTKLDIETVRLQVYAQSMQEKGKKNDLTLISIYYSYQDQYTEEKKELKKLKEHFDTVDAELERVNLTK